MNGMTSKMKNEVPAGWSEPTNISNYNNYVKLRGGGTMYHFKENGSSSQRGK
jgi:hypothetical protein